MPLGTEVGLSLRDIMLDFRNFRPMSVVAKRLDELRFHLPTLGTEVGLGPGEFVLDGDPAPPRKKGHTHPHPYFGLLIYCGHTAGWMKTPLGTEVDLGPGHIVLDGVSAAAKGAQQPLPLFSAMSVVAKVAHLSYC